MRDYRDAKTMAQTLRSALSKKSINLKQSESLEIIAKTLGVKDWNTLSAAIRTDEASTGKLKRCNAQPSRFIKPAGVPALPLRDVVVFPKNILALYVGRDRSLRAAEEAIKCGRVLAVTQRAANTEEPDLSGLYRIGVVAAVRQWLNTETALMLTIEGLQRARVEDFCAGEFFEAKVAPVGETNGDKDNTLQLAQKLRFEFQNYAATALSPSIRLPPGCERDAGYLADQIAGVLSLSIEEKQRVLETLDIVERLRIVAELMEQTKTAA